MRVVDDAVWHLIYRSLLGPAETPAMVCCGATGRDYTVWLSERAHEMGMYWGLKNSYEMIEKWPELVPQGVWDFGIQEEVSRLC
jgi:hypothetical protein